ncbi:MAG: hypothetical protein IKP96_02710 [Elusimicrobiaceae bacterium]|nr:hypothetical protein [Elusimicrobiaceae bacterium]
MSALFALIFSLMAPGAGHILTGNYGQGIVLGSLFALGKNAFLPLSLRLFGVYTYKRTLQFFYVWNWFYIVLIVYAVVSAVWYGWNVQEMYFFQTLIFILAVRLVHKNTKSKIIFTALCGRSGIYELMEKMHKSPTEKKKNS